MAAENGADFIKSQFHMPSEEMSPSAKSVIPPHTKKSIYEIIEDCSLTPEEEYELKLHIEKLIAAFIIYHAPLPLPLSRPRSRRR